MENFTAVVAIIFCLASGYIFGRYFAKRKFGEKIPWVREDVIKKSRSVIAGQMSEQIAPYFPDFPYRPTEARFIGKPIDFVVFNGLDEKKTSEIVFVEVKTGKSSLNNSEASLKEAVENKNVSWFEYRMK